MIARIEALRPKLDGKSRRWFAALDGYTEDFFTRGSLPDEPLAAEAVLVTFDPEVVSYGQLLSVFFTVAHDPTQLDRQGPDTGPQYRSAIFYKDAAQQRAAEAYVAELQPSLGTRAIVTQRVPLAKFFPAEASHQDFMRLNPMHPYIVVHDRPKVAHLRQAFPKLFVAEGLAAR